MNCEIAGEMLKLNEAKIRDMNGKARGAAFKSILDIVNTLSKQVEMMMKLKEEKEKMLATGKEALAKICPPKGALGAQGGYRYKKRNRKTYRKQKRGGRGKSRRRRKQKHRRTKRR